MADDALLTLRQLADQLQLPESTIRYYRDAFLDHIPSVGTGRRRRYPREAVVVLRTIARAYAAGRSKAEIVGAINQPTGVPTQAAAPVAVKAAKAAPTRSVDEVTNLDLLAAILDGEREQRDALWQMANEIVRLTGVLEGQDKVINEIADKAGVKLLPQQNAERRLQSAGSTGEPAGADTAQPATLAPAPAALTVPPLAVAPASAPAAVEGWVPPAPMASTHEPAAEPAGTEVTPPSDTRPGATGDMEALRAELESERALVERLRVAKLELEHRAADAEAALADRKPPRPSLIGRILGGPS